MSRLKQLRKEGKLTFLLALPLIAGQVSQMLIGLADTLMLARLGDVPLAAGAFGITILMIPLMLGVGISTAVSVKTSQARGAKQPFEAQEALRQGVYLALALGVLVLFGAFAILPFLDVFGQKPEVVEIVGVFFVIYAISCLPELVAMCLRNHANAMNQPWPAFKIVMSEVILNIFLNWLLIYGKMGFPQMGLEGAAVAALIARSAALVAFVLWMARSRSMQGWVPVRWFAKIDWKRLRALFLLAFPTSIQVVCEVGAFNAALLLIGSIGVEQAAAHQVVITCAGVVFMIPLGLSMATTVRVGQAWGAKEPHRLRPILYGSALIGFGFFVLTAQSFLFFNDELAALFLHAGASRDIAATLFLLAALFQFTDYIQILATGALRGLGDVSYAAKAIFVAYWIISLPIGYVLAFHYGLGVYGVWWGLVLGVFLSAIALSWRVMYKTGKKSLSRALAKTEAVR